MRARKPLLTFSSLLTFLGLSAATAWPWYQAQEGGEAGKLAIRPGTALAKLVDEADTHQKLLTAGQRELPLKIDIPLWLRSHYRRNHPEMRAQVREGDPTGGFPMALESLYLWMLRHQDLQPVADQVGEEPTRAVEVGKNAKISGKSSTPRSESDIRINPGDTKKIIGASNNPGGSQQAHFFSADGGVSWGQSFLPLIPGDSLHSDPTVDWTSDGTAWATTIGISAGSTVLQMRAYQSKDGGKTWTFDATFSGSQTSADKQQMCVDGSASSPFRDNIYVIWHNNAPAFVNRRTSDGWQVPIQVSGNETTGTAIGSDITTNAKGDVFAVWPDTGTRNIFLVKSTDGGKTHSSTPIKVAQTFGSFQISVPSFAERAALIGVSIAAFRDDSRDNVYVSWVDLSGENGCDSAGGEPGDDVKSSCKSRIWFARSIDGGTTWEAPKKISDGAGLNDQYNQKLRVDPSSGTLGIVYYDTAADPGRKKANLVFQASADNGSTWSGQVTVSSALSDETNPSADHGNQYGDYNGMTVAGDVFFPSWTDHRDGGAEAIYTAKITVTKDAAGHSKPVVEAVANGSAPTRGGGAAAGGPRPAAVGSNTR
jgi:hypothetical protein